MTTAPITTKQLVSNILALSTCCGLWLAATTMDDPWPFSGFLAAANILIFMIAGPERIMSGRFTQLVLVGWMVFAIAINIPHLWLPPSHGLFAFGHQFVRHPAVIIAFWTFMAVWFYRRWRASLNARQNAAGPDGQPG